ncbi:di-trans,poly-cis-decaprenylcistransferase [Aetokthonos hydrillicola CCALA 1050]|nr:di-trans,poly-cis-decaprenylcistransferase [Aetokthonos hydrillicola CCALA 1050]
MPRHLAIILDGNRRWARANKLADVSEGHRIGFNKIPEVLSWCEDLGIRIVTLWMLSTDNIRNRPSRELAALYEIDEDVVQRLVETKRFKLNAIGSLKLLPDRLAGVLRTAVQKTKDVSGMLVNLGIAYGGREDILEAIQSVIADVVASGEIEITEELFSARLSTGGQPDPDLVIRTSGEYRTSGFLLWQAALSELYFCDCHWPDFTRTHLLRAVEAYSLRDRRFGY